MRLDDGKCEVRLPLKANFEEELGKKKGEKVSKSKAIAQFSQIKRKFEKHEIYQRNIHNS